MTFFIFLRPEAGRFYSDKKRHKQPLTVTLILYSINCSSCPSILADKGDGHVGYFTSRNLYRPVRRGSGDWGDGPALGESGRQKK